MTVEKYNHIDSKLDYFDYPKKFVFSTEYRNFIWGYQESFSITVASHRCDIMIIVIQSDLIQENEICIEGISNDVILTQNAEMIHTLNQLMKLFH